MILRKQELVQLLAAMDVEYPGEREYLAAIANLVEGMLGDRKSYVVVLGVDTIQVPYAVVGGLAQAKRDARAVLNADTGLTAKLVEIRPASDLKLVDWEPETRYCPSCGHPKGAHEGSRGCIVGFTMVKGRANYKTACLCMQ